jgi:hypothetical protein
VSSGATSNPNSWLSSLASGGSSVASLASSIQSTASSLGIQNLNPLASPYTQAALGIKASTGSPAAAAPAQASALPLLLLGGLGLWAFSRR